MKKIKEMSELNKEIIRLYFEENKKPKEISEKFNIWATTVNKIIRQSGRKPNKLKKVRGDVVIEVQVIIDYIRGISSEDIGPYLGISPDTVRRILKEYGINIRPDTLNKRKYKIPLNYFEAIDTQEKAYFLGLLYADGSVSEKGAGVKITLHEQDRDILEVWSNIMYGFSKIFTETRLNEKTGKITNYLTVYIYSNKIKKDLAKLGCMSNKTFILTFPLFLGDENLRHFIRGYMDGDGCICTTNENRPRVDFTGNKEFIEGLKDYIENLLKIDIGKICQRHEDYIDENGNKVKGTNSRNFQILDFDKVKKFLDYIYDGATVSFDRKRNKYYEVLNQLDDKNIKILSKKNNIDNYGTTYVPEIKGIKMLKANVVNMSEEEKDALVEPLFDFYRQNGFPYITHTDDELILDFNNLKNLLLDDVFKGNIFSNSKRSGIKIFKHFAPHFNEVNSGTTSKPSLLDGFNNDEILKRTIRNRLSENCEMTGNMLKQGLGNSRNAYKASIFMPSVAKAIYLKYATDGDIIYDYSMGFGQRLTAAMSLPFDVKYVGVDPYKKSFDSNNDIFNFLSENVPGLNRSKSIDIRCVGSESFYDLQYENKIKIAFSSPPYFDIEQYCNDKEQAYAGSSYVNFINKWWKATVINIYKMLKNDGVFIINAADKIKGFNLMQDMSNIAIGEGFVQVDHFSMKLVPHPNFAGLGMKMEPIIVFKKK